ncbi:hypothetical protein DCS_07778 [Drechmeria coniospora]|uniref:Uncharacterized protein n=1 Tax=Drechmeria coniospora TaxID=98403 RepID=A0A151GFF0_DRECN|nr:hypothetical protein DCS_07778 [Drechmeria coniospora]KYK55814.1 hypothetical protein DCS_07778 [Drechmeria coniospora]
MNRFRTKKKNKDDVAESESSNPFRLFGKKKQPDEEPKQDLDLTAVLPSSDNFRTSLLMTGLSARFSMLREQDDPNSMLGKASDDSVLFAKRQSRLGEFGLGVGLHDIAEAASPKAAQFDSYISDDATSISGSVMNRSKPLEGNNLFGGRQKIYKISAGSSKSGRALYGDDISQSAFQKWKQTERSRHSAPTDESTDAESEPHYDDFNRRRETSSTTSSIPSAARSSTAATSIASSQPASSVSVKDFSTAGAVVGSMGQVPQPDRSVNRTRRLYEQGLNLDLQNQQSFALSRIDTLSRSRLVGTPGTQDLTSPISSPTISSATNATFDDRVLERRPILSKASAPNLRSYSPPATGFAHPSPAESNSGFARHEQRPVFAASPPLSPPVSEPEVHPVLPNQPAERGKATPAELTVRPAPQHYEPKHAQQRHQLQERTAPTMRKSTDSQSLRSCLSPRMKDGEKREPQTELRPEPIVPKDDSIPFLLDESDDDSAENKLSVPSIAVQPSHPRPNDKEHPAFRQSALPTPLRLSSTKMTTENSPPGSAASAAAMVKIDPPADSPTLGPPTGLSGMVRSHLRRDSQASSMQGVANEETKTTPAEPHGLTPEPRSPMDKPDDLKDDAQPAEAVPDEQDEFARHLADGARRVRERLTSYVESDVDRSAPVTPTSEVSKESQLSRLNSVSMLRSKSSRSSLFDRESRKSAKMDERVPVKNASSTSLRKLSQLSSPGVNVEAAAERQLGEDEHAEQESAAGEKEEGVHAALRMFRQARWELKRVKDPEMIRYQQPKQSPATASERPPAQRVLPNEVPGPVPTTPHNRRQDESRGGSRPRADSRAESERDRSGSETSSGGPKNSRGARLRDGAAANERAYAHNGAVRAARPAVGLSTRPAGSPGTDARLFPMIRSPHSNTGAPTSPSRRAVTVDVLSSRRMGMRRDNSDSGHGSANGHHDGQARSRYGRPLNAAVSTPNLRVAAAAPPLPPINPRRKNGSERSSYGVSDELSGGASVSDEETRPKMYPYGGRRLMAGANGRSKQGHLHSGGTRRSPVSRANVPDASLIGGMI